MPKQNRKVPFFLWDHKKETALNLRWIKHFRLIQHPHNGTWRVAASVQAGSSWDWFTILDGLLTEDAARLELEKLLDGKIK